MQVSENLYDGTAAAFNDDDELNKQRMIEKTNNQQLPIKENEKHDG
jgi:hypothetical protein